MNALPAHLAHRQRRDIATAAIGGINVGAGPHISIKDNRFTIVDGAGNSKPVMQLFLDVCIIDVNASVSKIFFDPNVKYDPSGENNNPPLCFSDNGVGASAQASNPQNTSCMACQWNIWGSSQSQVTGKQTKACNDVKKMAVVIPGDPSQLVYLLRVPPASLKNLAKYTQTVAGHGVDLPDVVTRLEFESQGVLKFTPTGYVDEATAWLTDKAWKEDATVRVVGKLDVPWNGQQLAAPQQRQGIAAPPQQQGAPTFMPLQPQAPMAPPASPNMFQDGQMQPPPGPFAPAPVIPAAPQPGAPMFSPGTLGAAGATPPSAESPKRTRKPRTPAAAAPEVPSFVQQPQQEVIPPGAPFVAPSAVAQPGPATAPPSGPFASPVPTSSGPVDTSIPPFLQRNPAPAAASPQPQNFGMQPNAPAPDAGVQAALDAAFNLPTGT